MKSLETIRTLGDIAAYQHGLFTAAQAKRAGIARYGLSRLEKAGAIERLAKGVYRMGGAPSSREEEVFTIWLSLVPDRNPGMSIGDEPIASGATSAWLQQLGEIGPVPYEFCCKSRRQTQRSGIRLRKCAIDPEDIVLVGGVPATSAALTVLDLIDAGEDLSLVEGVLRDALARHLIEDEGQLACKVDSRSAKVGLPRGASLYRRLTGKGGDPCRLKVPRSSTVQQR